LKPHVTRLSFEKGMTENVKQDMFGQEHHSALWLQNYDNNLEYGSLVKRPAIGQYKDAELDFGDLENWSYKLFRDQTPGETDVMLHARMLRTANPKYNDTVLLFIKRKPNADTSGVINTSGKLNDWYDNSLGFAQASEAVGIVAYVYKWDGTNWTLSWSEPWKDGMIYPGWYPLGTLHDATRYGEAVLFTTSLVLGDSESDTDFSLRLKSLKNSLFPCYIWKRWDITKKRDDENQFWNSQVGGIESILTDLSDKTKYSGNKIAVPTSRLVKNNTVKGYYVNTALAKLYNIDDNLEVVSDDIADISLIFWDHKLRKDSYHSGIYEKLDYLDIPEVSTSEELNHKSIVDNIISEYSTWPNDEPISGIFRYPPTRKTFVTNENRLIEYLRCGRANLNPYFLTNLTKYGDVYYLALSTHLPDYIKAKLPRPWLREERIPFVLTMVIDGVEILLYEETYIVKYGNLLYAKDEYCQRIANFTVNENRENVRKAHDNLAIRKPESTIEAVFAPTYKTLATDSDGEKYSTLRLSDNWDSADIQYRVTQFGLRIKEKTFKNLVDSNVSAIRLYVSKPSTENGLFRTVGTLALVEPPLVLYKKPVTEELDQVNKDYSQYGLVKEFRIDGKGTFVDNYDNYDGIPAIASNAWVKTKDYFVPNEDAIWAMPQEDNSDIGTNKYPEIRNLSNSWGLPFRFYAVKDLSGDRADQGILWTPDFTLWDYPTNSPPLTLQSSGEYWDGIGARLIVVIKGRTLLLGTIDSEGVEEQAITRFSAVQSGVASPDVFNKEDKIQIGHLPHTAALEFREQLLVFNKEVHYRILMPNAYDYTTWEFLEAVEGGGCLGKKLIVDTPHGFVYANDRGLWISEGNIPQSLTDNPGAGLAVNSLYQHLMTGNVYPYTSLVNPGQSPIDTTYGFNRHMELLYDTENDELVLTTPIDITNTTYTVQQGEFRMIFNFSSKTWRTEYYNTDITETYSDTCTIVTSNIYHRLKFIDNGIVSLSSHFYRPDNDLSNSFGGIAFAQQDLSRQQDLWHLSGLSGIGGAQINIEKDILARVISHEVGDNENDFLLQRAIIEVVPFESIVTEADGTVNILDITQVLTNEPIFAYELRNRKWSEQVAVNDWIDLIYKNLYDANGELIKGRENIFGSWAQTPGGSGDGSGNGLISGDYTGYSKSNELYAGSYTYAGRESLILLAPMGLAYRSARFKWDSIVTAKLGTMEIMASVARRRGY